MPRDVTILGAPCNIGIRPYDDGTPRRLDRAPDALRRAGVAAAADDAGDVRQEPYRDFVRPPDGARNEPELVRYADTLATRLAGIVGRRRLALLLGGDCSIVLGALLGLRRAGHQRVGLVYVDGHADFATPAESSTGSAASMCLALAVGRGASPLARLAGDAPLVAALDVVVVGRRDEEGDLYGNDALRALPVLDLPHRVAAAAGYATLVDRVLGRVAHEEMDGFWVHVDADVLSPLVMPAVDSPEPGGPDLDDLAPFLAGLLRHPRALGLELTIYDPELDPDGACARRLVSLLARALGAGPGAVGGDPAAPRGGGIELAPAAPQPPAMRSET